MVLRAVPALPMSDTRYREVQRNPALACSETTRRRLGDDSERQLGVGDQGQARAGLGDEASLRGTLTAWRGRRA